METNSKFANQVLNDGIGSVVEGVYSQVGQSTCNFAMVSSDGKNLKAHKIVAAIGSNYLKKALLVVEEFQFPIVTLPDIHSEELLFLLEFIYTGSTSVPKAKLEAVLKAAEILQIKGLSQVSSNNDFVTYLSSWEAEAERERQSIGDEVAVTPIRPSLPKAPSNELEYDDQLLGMDLSLSRSQGGGFARPLRTQDYSEENLAKKRKMDSTENTYDMRSGCRKASLKARSKTSKHTRSVTLDVSDGRLTVTPMDRKTLLFPPPCDVEEPLLRPLDEDTRNSTDKTNQQKDSGERSKNPPSSKFSKCAKTLSPSEKGSKKAKFPAINPLTLFTLPQSKKQEKQTRTSLSLDERVKVIESFVNGKSQRQIASYYGIGKTQVNGIIKKREQILSFYKESLLRGDKITIKRNRKSEYASVNEHLIQWYRHMSLVAGVKITTAMLRAKALEIAPELGYHDFKASNGWLATFKANNNLKFSKVKKPCETYSNDNYEQEDNNQDDEYFHEDEEIDSDDVSPTSLNPSLTNGPPQNSSVHIPRENVHPESVASGVPIVNPGILGTSALPKPQTANMALGSNLAAAYNLTRDHTRPELAASRPDLSHLNEIHPGSAVNPLVAGSHSTLSKPDASLSYKSEESLAYGYDPQARMNEGTSRGSEYNYTHYGFPGTYYGYHFLAYRVRPSGETPLYDSVSNFDEVPTSANPLMIRRVGGKPAELTHFAVERRHPQGQSTSNGLRFRTPPRGDRSKTVINPAIAPECYPVNMNFRNVSPNANAVILSPTKNGRRRLPGSVVYSVTAPTPFISEAPENGSQLRQGSHQFTQNKSEMFYPKASPNGYQLYRQNVHAIFKHKYAGKSQQDIVAMVAESWNELGQQEKLKWKNKAEEIRTKIVEDRRQRFSQQ